MAAPSISTKRQTQIQVGIQTQAFDAHQLEAELCVDHGVGAVVSFIGRVRNHGDQPDVIGLQETKVHDDMFPLEEVARLGYNVFYHGQKGHYGVALLTKETPIAVRRGFPNDGEEAQRRANQQRHQHAW